VSPRTVFATPRAAEFLEMRALQAQTGQPVDAFGHVVVKELLDNALDAAELGPEPAVSIEVRRIDGLTFVTVTDNGCGISAATVADICDFNVLASDKARYRGPARGAQGNALKTILGIPYALDVSEPVVIDSRGVRHELALGVDRYCGVVVEHGTSPGHTEGTAVTVALPSDIDVDVQRWALGAALVNPHVAITVGNPGNGDPDSAASFYKPAGQRHKWTAGDPASPHWYDKQAFAALVGAYVREAERTGVDVPLGKFISEFDGLTGSVKQKAVRKRKRLDGITHLSQLDDDTIDALHAAMCSHAKPTAPNRLGAVGAEHLRSLLDAEYRVKRFWYKKLDVAGTVPWLIEVAIADTWMPGETWFATNHSPSFGDPLGHATLLVDDRHFYGCAALLNAPYGGPHRAAVIHVVCAATQFVDKGKVALVVPGHVAGVAAAAVGEATKVLRREDDQREKNAAKAERAARRAAAAADRLNRWTIKEAVFEVLPEAKRRAGYTVGVRTLFYKVRPLIQQYTDDELDYAYFGQTLLPEYQRTVAKLPGVYYEARGALHHPHDGRVIPLGTREVDAYIPPDWQFDKVLYIEKEGLEAQLAPYQLGQRHDMAIIYGKGFSPTACRDLLARSEIRSMKLFVLHDADINGYNIARTLGEATRRMPDHSVDVIDLGLTVPQAIAVGLETETFIRRKALPSTLELDPDALVWFTGDPMVGLRQQYRCTRCELNAFSADGLVEFIEAGLRAHGADAKLIPPDDVMSRHTDGTCDATLTDLVADEINRLIDVDAIVARLREDNPELADVAESDVTAALDVDRTKSWRKAADELVDERIDDAGLSGDIRALIADQLSQENL
jgi:hypothetical protein